MNILTWRQIKEKRNKNRKIEVDRREDKKRMQATVDEIWREKMC